MKVVMVTPCYHQQRGNTVTVQRISQFLARHGVYTEVISLTEEKSYHYRNRSEGIPVLASDVIGNRDIVEHGKNGFLYGNSEEFFHFACLLQPLKKLD